MVPLADHHPGWSANRRGVQLCGNPDKPEDVCPHGRPAHTTPSETNPAVGRVDEWPSAAVSTACNRGPQPPAVADGGETGVAKSPKSGADCSETRGADWAEITGGLSRNMQDHRQSPEALASTR